MKLINSLLFAFLITWIYGITYSVPPPKIKTPEPIIVKPITPTLEKVPEPVVKIYNITIESDALKKGKYISYKKQGEGNYSQILKSHFIGINNLKEHTRYKLEVKETNKSNEIYLELKRIMWQQVEGYDGSDVADNYKITIEKDGLDEPNYITYTKEGQTEPITFFPRDHLLGVDINKKARYVLKVNEVVKNDQTYLQVIEILEPKLVPQKPITITIEPFDDYHKIKYSYIKNGIETQEILDDTFIVGMDLQKNIRYKLKVENIETDFIRFKLLEQIEPKEPSPGRDGVLPYTCNGEIKTIATKNEIITTDYILAYDGNIKIKHIDIDEPLKIFTGQIFGFTFIEDHKYTLEVKLNGFNYVLITKLCDSIANIVSRPDIKKYPDFENNEPVNPPIDSSKNGDFEKPKVDSVQKPHIRITPPPNFKPKSIDEAAWYLRYLYQADGLTPINDREDTSYVITFAPLQKISKLKTPCGDIEANFINDDNGFFNFYNVNGFYSKCDETTKLLIEQLKTVKKYDLKDNVLKLSLNGKVLIQLEGFPK